MCIDLQPRALCMQIMKFRSFLDPENSRLRKNRISRIFRESTKKYGKLRNIDLSLRAVCTQNLKLMPFEIALTTKRHTNPNPNIH